ncbi:Ig-like domain-containing protein [Xanthomarina sp. F2636L]|uniref:Ig-like domain-containing protein n=1 Tax=Xanthomarina sp. F2636L TaxID=2996018 RepID=UPI00225E440A|nr:Ig-like domain-containing protein [Xanthomarina sp. F2636L]MCX7551068.1 Ig-like domain-containing protein [Xanthomarina sp. F2636L]
MNRTFYKSLQLIICCIFLANCANKGTPGGGVKDITPPVIVKSVPENFSTNFKETEIRITFNEYIKINNLQKQLIISPPMDPAPEILPQGTASKYITIKITDTLDANTTYAFNFGNSIVDNNEGNPYPYYRYVFSTGDYIDSLSVKGNIIDASLQKPDKFVSIMLYEMDSTFTDSTVYKKKPKYITNTLDSTTTFSIDNIKAGKYKIIALKDENQDSKYQQRSDKIGFLEETISVPKDTLYTIKLFKEVSDPKIINPRLISGEKIAFGFEGDFEKMNILIQSNTPEDFSYRVTKDAKSDSLNYWYKPRFKDTDSLLFKVTNKNYSENFTVRISEQKKDTLIIKASPTSTIGFEEDFNISGNIPFEKIARKRISIKDKDSVDVSFKTKLDSLKNALVISFDKTENNRYNIQVLPNAFTDFFENKNDTLNYTVSTKAFEEYGNVRVNLKNARYPVIVQLTDEKGEVKVEKYSKKSEPIDFKYVTPNEYYLRVIHDANKNKKYDSGNYLKKQQPEKISYLSEKQEVRSNFDYTIDFTLL